MPKILTLNCLVAALTLWIFSGASAMAGDTYGTYRLAEREFVNVAGEKHPIRVAVWKHNKGIVNIPSYTLKTDQHGRRYARIEHDKNLQDQGTMVAEDDSPKIDKKKVLGVYQLAQKNSANGFKNNVFVWKKKPETLTPEIKLVKSNGKITIVHIDRHHKDQRIQLADKSINK